MNNTTSLTPRPRYTYIYYMHAFRKCMQIALLVHAGTMHAFRMPFRFILVLCMHFECPFGSCWYYACILIAPFLSSFPSLLIYVPPLPQSMYNNLTQLRRMADRFAGTNHFAADSLQRQVAKLSAKFSRFETYLAERRKVVVGSLRFHTSFKEVGAKEPSSEDHRKIICAAATVYPHTLYII